MKKILIIIAILGFIMPTYAQVFNTKSEPTNILNATGPYGHQAVNYSTGTICAVVNNTVTPVASGKKDTLSNTDTGYVQFTLQSGYDFLFDFAVTKITGTVAGTSLLQGSIDNATWHTLTGNTTYCADCQGASCTVTNTAGTKHYQWYIPGHVTNYPYYQIQTITSGTCTASYSGTATYKN